MNFGFIRAACISPELLVADCDFNADKIIESAKRACQKGAKIIVFPELSITGYSCGDLFFQRSLQKSAEAALMRIIKETADFDCLIFTGLPVPSGEGIYNCGAASYRGELLSLTAKTFIPNYGEFYERRQFTPFQPDMESRFISFAGFDNVPFGSDILICDKKNPEVKIACELCEDLWVPLPPSTRHALNGANVIVNLSGGNEIIGKADYRRDLVKNHSARLIAAYLYSNCSNGESSQDMVFAGHKMICENGSILAQSGLFDSQDSIFADIDIERLCQERRRTTSFGFSVNHAAFVSDYLTVEIDLLDNKNDYSASLIRFVDAHPFVPADKNERKSRCEEVITLQAQGLAKRLKHIKCQSAVIGLSGGLDSTLALLVTCRAFDICNISRKKITCITMPCFGTTDRTYKNACLLARESGVSLKEIPIADSVRQHFKDIGQDESVHDVTYENGQARTRTLVLMNYANKTNGIVIGTGDLSELALGWCTYNGDHMSMYGVNSSVPKTLVRYLVDWFCQEEKDKNESLSKVLQDILDTPVSPELLPPQEGKISQVTEDLVGPYELHDFYLYYLLRFGFSPKKIFYLAKSCVKTAADFPEKSFSYDDKVLLKWLKTFYRRFFSQQFKRSCMPDGAKVGSVNLSPRGDWRMPSDACAAVWLKEIDSLEEEISSLQTGKGRSEC